MCRSITTISGAATAARRVRSISRPVVSWKWSTRRLECRLPGPGRVRSRRRQRDFPLVEVHAQRDQFADAGRPVADDGAHGFLVAQARAGFERVLDVRFEGVLAAPHARHAALRPRGARIRRSAFGDDRHPPVRRRLEREGQARHAAADHDEIETLHRRKFTSFGTAVDAFGGFTTRLSINRVRPKNTASASNVGFVDPAFTGCRSSASTISA